MAYLRQIRTDNLDELAEDIQENFKIIMSSPTFRGQKGGIGDAGVAVQGLRGSKLFVIDLPIFNSEYGGSFNNSSLNLNVVNAKHSDDVSKLLLSMKTPDIINGDMLILPNGSLNRYNGGSDQWEGTNIQLITAETAASLGGSGSVGGSVVSNANVANSIIEIYTSLQKQVPDTDPNAATTNLNQGNNSVIDIEVTQSGSAYVSPDHRFIASSEAIHNNNGNPVRTTTVVGDPNKLNTIIQNMLQSNLNTDNSETNDGIDSGNEPINIIIQNSLKHGILLGHDSLNLNKFAHIHRDNSNLILSATYQSNGSESNTLVKIGENAIEIQGEDIVFLTKNIRILGEWENQYPDNDERVLVRDQDGGQGIVSGLLLVKSLKQIQSDQPYIKTIPSTDLLVRELQKIYTIAGWNWQPD